MEILSAIFGSDYHAKNIFEITLMFFGICLSIFSFILIARLLYSDYKDRKARVIRKQFLSENISLRMLVTNLGAPPNILFKNNLNLENSTDNQPIVASIDFLDKDLDKDQYAFISLCCWGKITK